jgi:Mg-chelatase subunit ChlD
MKRRRASASAERSRGCEQIWVRSKAMSPTEKTEMCQKVEEELTQILDGSAPAHLFDHLADCDTCRDLRYEATRVAEIVGKAGKDFHPAEDFVDRLAARLEAARPESASQVPVASAPREVPQTIDRGNVVVRSDTKTLPGLETAATVFDPLAAARAEEAASAVPAPAPAAGNEPIAKTWPSESQRESAPEPSAPAVSGVSATTHHGPITAPKTVPPTIAEQLDTRAAIEAVLEPSPSALAAPAPPAIGAPVDRRAAPKPSPRSKVSLFRRPAILAGAAAALAAAAGVGLYLKGSKDPGPVTTTSAPWWGSVASVARAALDKTGGFEACDASGACAVVESGGKIKKGSTLRTDARTRAHVTLADGTELSLDRGSEVELSSTSDRTARVKRGTIVADVAHVDGATAHFAFPHGDVEVLGTKLALSAGDDRASVEVARGTVRLRGDGGKWVEVRAGEEATLLRGQEPVVASSSSLADVMEWSDKKPEEVDAPVLRGLGELRARKPGQTKEKDRAVRLAKHAVKVRIVDVVARTEVDETFANDTDEELEGIFRFPLPPGAQIERLALEVDGKLIEGAFVDRDKGAAIWRGVIQNAAPKAPKPREEIFWVPGPWRDPALLEWQRGGRFELKIFPIPKRGSRRVVLTYTQTVDQAAGIRRFTYPLAHDPSGTTKVDSFDMDMQVLGLDKPVGLTTRGYDLQPASGDGDRRVMHADAFIPAGDLTVEYALPDRDKEATAWAYSMSPAPGATLATGSPTATPAKIAPKTPEEKAAAAAAEAILGDTSPYVAIALRPRLPRWQEAKERLHVIVVDASRSMIGERFARATRLASGIVREMDRRDSFVVLACDTICRPMSGEAGGAARPEVPGAAASEGVERFLGQIEPDGGSDLAAAMSAARTAAGSTGGKELRIIYLGDGTPTVGPTRPAHLETAVRSAIPTGDGAVVAVALGADADTTSLSALARGGGGVVVPYVPGQKVSSAALDVLGAAYGVVLRDPEVELPSGLSQVTPARLDPIRAGGETLIVARMTGGSEVSGVIKLKGRVAGERFEQTYPLKVIASSNAGNAFVPRLYAAAKITELERIGGDAQKPTVIELSKRFAVASRFTSLLVLESEAMFKAFGLDRSSAAPSFTGEQLANSSSADADGEPADDEVAEKSRDGVGFGPSPSATSGPATAAKPKRRASLDTLNPFGGEDERADKKDSSGLGLGGVGRGGGGVPGGSPPLPAPEAEAAVEAPRPRSVAPDPFTQAAPAQPTSAPRPPAKVAGPSNNEPRRLEEQPFDARLSRRRFVPMRKVFDRNVSFDAQNTFASQNASKLTVAESAFAVAPDSRDKTVDLFALYSTSGRINEAQELTAKWSGRDALDPDALNARADLAARQGDRDRAVRILGGLAEVRPNDRTIQARLADLQDAAGNAALACEHRLALADMAPGDAKLIADAVRCARAQGQVDLASQLKLDAADKVREAVDRLLLAAAPSASALRGDVQLSAEWASAADLDLALVDAQGKRTSWLGSPSKAVATVRDATSLRTETLAISGLAQGNYVVEISRAAGRDTGETVRGTVTLRLGNDVRKVPFTLTGSRAEIGTVKVFFTSRLVPLDGAPFIQRPWDRRF